MTLVNSIKTKISFREIKDFVKMLYYNMFYKTWIELFGTSDKRKLKYRISLCLIFKNEAPFLKEWLDYHLTIGIDHFYLYNNNSDDNFMEVLKPFLDKELVTLIDWPEAQSQLKCYKHCYESFRSESNWISFLDADEFICPKYDNDINDWIRRYDKYPAIVIQWLMFGTNGILCHDYDKNVIEQYYSCWEKFYPKGKCFINTRYDIANYDTWHLHHHTRMKVSILGVMCKVPAVNQFKNISPIKTIYGGGRNPFANRNIQINHYFMKGWDVFDKKRNKSDVLFEKSLRKDYSTFCYKEEACTMRDFTIQRFFIKMKLYQNIIK